VNLDGAVTIITGAGHGIGAATARAFAERGAQVVALGPEPDELTALAAAIGADPFCADVRDPAHAEAVVAHVRDRYGRLDVVVANAGIGHSGLVAEMSAQRISDLVAVNVTAPMLLARSALPIMLEQGRGAFVLISSIAGSLLVPTETVYSATKAAVNAFAEPLQTELHGTGVTVSTVVPAVVATDFFRARGEPYERRFPRPIDPSRIAAAVVAAAQTGKPRYVVPRWFTIPMRLRAVAPASYRRLARRFGG